MHTVFRVYGNAIGRTALCSRTVGRGFKSVARIIGRGPREQARLKNAKETYVAAWQSMASLEEMEQFKNELDAANKANVKADETEANEEVMRQLNLDEYNETKVRAIARNQMTDDERIAESGARKDKKHIVRDLVKTRIAYDRMDKPMPPEVGETFRDEYNILRAHHQSLLTKFDVLQNSTLSDQVNDEKGDELITEVETAIEHAPVGEVKETLKILKQEIHDAGYSKTLSLYKIEKRLETIVWDPVIFDSVNADGTLNPPGEIIEGIFEPTIATPDVFIPGDFFNVLPLPNSDTTYNSLMNQQRLWELYSTLSPDGTYYPGVYKIQNTQDIVASKGFELSLCANDALTTEILGSLYSNQNPDLEAMDSICQKVGITSPTTQPFDSFSRTHKSFLEFKYYKNKLYFTRSCNANKLLMKELYQDLKIKYIKTIDALEENPTNRDLKKEKKRLTKILQSCDDFERYFLQNHDYVGVNIKCTKLPEIPNGTQPISNSEQQLDDYKNKKSELSPTITFDKSYKIKGITINKGAHKQADTNKYSELIGDNGCSLDFAIGCKDGIVTYSLSNDPLISDRNIFEIFKVGEVADHQGRAHIINALNIPMHRMTLSHRTTSVQRKAKAPAEAKAAREAEKEAKAKATAEAKAVKAKATAEAKAVREVEKEAKAKTTAEAKAAREVEKKSRKSKK